MTKFIRIGIETFAAKKQTSGGATSTFFYHNDHLGGVNVITDSAGVKAQLIEYDPWGKVSVCDEDSYFTELVRYIHLNPLERRMPERCASMQREGEIVTPSVSWLRNARRAECR
ncbi:MAG: hypothetical protein ACREQK_21055 [Candidatus Binatia bacterium]